MKVQQFKVRNCILNLNFVKRIYRLLNFIYLQSQVNFFEKNIFKILYMLLKIIKVVEFEKNKFGNNH
jgi:hypothetical protein